MEVGMKKEYVLAYEVVIEAVDIGEAVKLGERNEIKMKSRLKKIEADDETWERFYEDE
jgi:hypothetical protein